MKKTPWKNDFSVPTEELKPHCVVFWGVGVNHLKQRIACLPLGLHYTLHLGRIWRMILVNALKAYVFLFKLVVIHGEYGHILLVY